MGYTLMPEMAAVASKGICYKKIQPEPSRSIGLIFRQTAPQTLLFKAIADKIKAIK
jgi:hypothetical protein